MDIYSIPGTYYLTQSQYLDHYDPLSPNESQKFLSAAATRLVIVIKADNSKVGYVAIIYIGILCSMKVWQKFRAVFPLDKKAKKLEKETISAILPMVDQPMQWSSKKKPD